MDVEDGENIIRCLRILKYGFYNWLEGSVPYIEYSNVFVRDDHQILMESAHEDNWLFLLVGKLLLNPVYVHFTPHKAYRILQVQHLLVHDIFQYWYRLLAVIVSHVEHFHQRVFLEGKHYWLLLTHSQQTYLGFMAFKLSSLHQILIFWELVRTKVVLIGTNKKRLVRLWKSNWSYGSSKVMNFRNNLLIF